MKIVDYGYYSFFLFDWTLRVCFRSSICDVRWLHTIFLYYWPCLQHVHTCTWTGRESAAEHVLYFKCHRKYYNGSASENTDLNIFCNTCL